MHLDTKLNFQEHFDKIMSKVDKTIELPIGLLCQLQVVLLHPFLVTIYKEFKRPHLGYGDIIYD